jgi:hypothetical protein
MWDNIKMGSTQQAEDYIPLCCQNQTEWSVQRARGCVSVIRFRTTVLASIKFVHRNMFLILHLLILTTQYLYHFSETAAMHVAASDKLCTVQTCWVFNIVN